MFFASFTIAMSFIRPLHFGHSKTSVNCAQSPPAPGAPVEGVESFHLGVWGAEPPNVTGLTGKDCLPGRFRIVDRVENPPRRARPLHSILRTPTCARRTTKADTPQ